MRSCVVGAGSGSLTIAELQVTNTFLRHVDCTAKNISMSGHVQANSICDSNCLNRHNVFDYSEIKSYGYEQHKWNKFYAIIRPEYP